MSETILAVIIGGLIASIVPVVGLYLGSKSWKKEKLLAYWERKRQGLDDEYQVIIKELDKGLRDNNYSVDMLTKSLVLMPKPVANAIDAFMSEEDRSVDKLKILYQNIHVAMKVSLLAIDDKIGAILDLAKEER